MKKALFFNQLKAKLVTDEKILIKREDLMRVLVAEDDVKIAKYLRQGLEAEGYAVDLALDGEEALWSAHHHAFDIVILDVRMPHRDGVSVVRELRRKGNQVPVLFLTGLEDVEDRVACLDAGADDYMVKPFSLTELLARMRALSRRQRPEGGNVLRVADLELDLLSHSAKRGDRTIELTKREFAILELLMTNSPKTVSKAVLVEHVWDQNFDSGTNVLNVHIKHLRDKVDVPGLPPLLLTVRNIGFAVRPFVADNSPAPASH
jgi:DNA-binding response OmpR family regulator